MKVNELTNLVKDLLEILSAQSKELEQLISHVEQSTGRLPDGHEMAVIRSSIAGLQHRLNQASRSPKKEVTTTSASQK